MSRARDTADQINRVNSSAADATAITVDSSENILAGKTSADFGATAGLEFRGGATDTLFLASDGNKALALNRNTSDGEIIRFSKSDSTVGSIGIQSTGFYIDGESGHAGVRFSGSALIPRDNESDSNGVNNLGSDINRFKDLYLSGGVYLGGTGSANLLDDAEYGVWNPGNYNIVLASTNGNYVKVGRMCTVAFRLVWPTNSNTAQAKISLPFACVSHGSNAHMAGLAIAFTTYTNTFFGGVYSGGTFMEFFKPDTSSLTNANLSGKQINGSVTYITNS